MEPNMKIPLPGDPSDPFLEEIRSIKESVAAQYGHDVVKLCQELRREQEESGRRLIRKKRAPATAASSLLRP
jgi:hypothetical protein